MDKLFRRVEHTIYNKNINDDIRIAAISDIHYSDIVKLTALSNILLKVESLKPDYISIVGDLIDSTRVLEDKRLRDNITIFIKSLARIAPVIISIGNHDFTSKENREWVYSWNEDFWNQIAAIKNVVVVNNSTFEDDKILMSGYTQPFDYYFKDKRGYLEAMIEDLKNEKEELLNPNSSLPKICLVHSPYRLMSPIITKYFKNYDVILSGHMHQGMVPPIIDDLIPGNKGLIAPSKFLFPNNARGTIQKENGQYIIISGGITKIGEESPKILHIGNIFYPMSIEDITLTNDEDKKTYQKKIKYEK